MNLSALHTIINDNRNAKSIANRFRRARADTFRQFLADIPRPCRILDIGGTENFWVQSGLLPMDGVKVTLLNLQQEAVSCPGIESVIGDATDLSRYKSREFDVAFSNSVIEHVGSHENQVRMATEMMRVGKHLFLQTPARYFPIEPHFLFPFFWSFPASLREKIVCTIPLGWYPKQANPSEAKEFLQNFILLTKPEIAKLFPNAKILEESVLGLTKSYIATQ